jgi:hypothetical protein
MFNNYAKHKTSNQYLIYIYKMIKNRIKYVSACVMFLTQASCGIYDFLFDFVKLLQRE